jgi:hypothetical protein
MLAKTVEGATGRPGGHSGEVKILICTCRDRRGKRINCTFRREHSYTKCLMEVLVPASWDVEQRKDVEGRWGGDRGGAFG